MIRYLFLDDRQWERHEQNPQIGYGEVFDEVVDNCMHLRLKGDDEAYNHIACYADRSEKDLEGQSKDL